MKFSLSITILSLFLSAASFAQSKSTVRGTLFAVDTRETRACEEALQTLKRFTNSADLNEFCHSDPDMPYIYAVVYSEISDNEYLAEVGMIDHLAKTDVLTPLKRSQEIGHSMRMAPNKESAKFEFVRGQPLYKSQIGGAPASISLPFVLRMNSVRQTSNLVLKKVLSYRFDRQQSDLGSADSNESTLSLYEIVNRAFRQAVNNENASLYISSPDSCNGQRVCPSEFQFGMSVTFTFKF